MIISEHITLAEVIRSDSAKRLGISNMPPPEHIENLKAIAENIFEPIRAHFRCPIYISSGYRSKELNKALNGAKNSDHLYGMAIDIDQDGCSNGITNNDIFLYAIEKLKFKQVIAEYPVNGKISWVHISYDKNNLKNEILVCTRQNGIIVYNKYNNLKTLIY